MRWTLACVVGWAVAGAGCAGEHAPAVTVAPMVPAPALEHPAVPHDVLAEAVRVLDGETSNRVSVEPVPLTRGGWVDAEVSPDGSSIAVTRPGSVELLALPSREVRWRGETGSHAPRVGFSRDGASLATVGPAADAYLHLRRFDVASGALQRSARTALPSVPAPSGSRMGLVSFALSRIAGSADGLGFQLEGTGVLPVHWPDAEPTREAWMATQLGGAERAPDRAALPFSPGLPMVDWTRLSLSPRGDLAITMRSGSFEIVALADGATLCSHVALGVGDTVGVGLDADGSAWLLRGEGELLRVRPRECVVESRAPCPRSIDASWVGAGRAFVAIDGQRAWRIPVDRPREASIVSGAADAVLASRDEDAFVVFSGDWVRPHGASGATVGDQVARGVAGHAGGALCRSRVLVPAMRQGVLAAVPSMQGLARIETGLDWGACRGELWVLGRGALPALVYDAWRDEVVTRLDLPLAPEMPRSPEAVALTSSSEILFVAEGRVWRIARAQP